MRQDIQNGLPRYALFSAMLAFVGLPIYIHAPKFFVDQYGLSLSAIGVALLAVRMLDFIQDPILGWLVDRLSSARKMVAGIASCVLALSLVALFAVGSPINPLIWFLICITIIFTAFSLLTIMFYAQGISKAHILHEHGHVRLAAWRETGALLGICLACITPLILQRAFPTIENSLALFSVVFLLLASTATFWMHHEWSKSPIPKILKAPPILHDTTLRRLLIVAFLNAAPVAVTSSLFLFFVEYRLNAEDAAGPLLLAFFLSAAIFAPLWGKSAEKYGAKPILLIGMFLSIIAFGFAYSLGSDNIIGFALVCIASGAALGADMTLLPAIFARRVAAISNANGQAFGIWNFCSKATLALSAVTMLPALEASGFKVGQINSETALKTLSVLYALVPCALKTLAFLCLLFTKLEEA